MSNPGKFDRRLTIQARTTGRDSEGGVTLTWTDTFERWAEKLPSTGREFRAALAQHATTQQVFRIRYLSGLNETDHRIVFEGKPYDIIHVAEVGRREFMLVSCTYTEGGNP